jgi:hypothetical protein
MEERRPVSAFPERLSFYTDAATRPVSWPSDAWERVPSRVGRVFGLIWPVENLSRDCLRLSSVSSKILYSVVIRLTTSVTMGGEAALQAYGMAVVIEDTRALICWGLVAGRVLTGVDRAWHETDGRTGADRGQRQIRTPS